MEERLSAPLNLPFPRLNHHPIPSKFTSLFTHFNSLIWPPPSRPPKTAAHPTTNFKFSSAILSLENPISPPNYPKLINPTSRNNPKVQSLVKNLSVFERALIGAAQGRIANAFTYVCLRLLNTIKTKLQTKGASELYKNTFDKYDKWSEEELLGVLSNEACSRALAGFGLG